MKVAPLHFAGGDKVLKSTGLGFTITTTFVNLVQNVGVTPVTVIAYVTLTGDVDVLVSTSLIAATAPAPAAFALIVAMAALVQAKVGLATAVVAV